MRENFVTVRCRAAAGSWGLRLEASCDGVWNSDGVGRRGRMAESGRALALGQGWPVLVHSTRTALVAVASFLVARLFRLPEAYWAPITSVVVTQ